MEEKANFLATVFYSLLLVVVGACFLMLGLDFINDFYPSVYGWSYNHCIIVMALSRALIICLTARYSDLK